MAGAIQKQELLLRMQPVFLPYSIRKCIQHAHRLLLFFLHAWQEPERDTGLHGG